jgi:hypothetical protein
MTSGIFATEICTILRRTQRRDDAFAIEEIEGMEEKELKGTLCKEEKSQQQCVHSALYQSPSYYSRESFGRRISFWAS